jgi:hypothetical protein
VCRLFPPQDQFQEPGGGVRLQNGHVQARAEQQRIETEQKQARDQQREGYEA